MNETTLVLISCGGLMAAACSAAHDTDTVHQDAGEVYFTATKDGPTERHLYTVPLSGGDIIKLTSEPGMHDITLSPTHDRFIDSWTNLENTPRIEIRSL